MKRTARAAGLLLAIATFTACSGSDGPGGGILGHGGPVARAGADQDVGRGAVVWLGLGASSSGAWPLTFQWTQTAGPAVTLSNAQASTPSFLAPSVLATLRFTLTVTDGAGKSSSDEVVVRVVDLAPVISGLTLSPARPITTDPLVASATVLDPDPDEVVTVSWEWRRNGAVLPGQTAATLPARLAVRGDVVVVTLRATDGFTEVSASASVTLQDAPPTVAISAPATATWGAPLTFTAAASDPDGDPVAAGACRLLRGPAGMTLSPACEGAWTPTLPMFDRELDVTFEVGLVGTTSRAEATVRVVDGARRYPLKRSGLEIAASRNGVVALDPDGDGTSTLFVGARSGLYELARDGGTYRAVWAYPFAPLLAAPSAVAGADVDGDGRAELFFSELDGYAGGGVLVKLDGVDRREVARVALSCADLELADLDRDGALELVCLAGSQTSLKRLVVLDPTSLATLWQSAELQLGESLAVGNVDGDPALEIVTAAGYVFDGATAAAEWVYGGGFGQLVDTGDLDGDGVEEIVGMDDWSRFRGFSAVLRSPLWEQATSDNDALLVADLDRDGIAEIVVGDGQWGNVTVYRYRPLTNDLQPLSALNSQGHGVMGLAAADLDGDGQLELTWGTGWSSTGADALVVAGRTPQLEVEWTSPAPTLDGPFVGAVAARTVAGAAPGLLFQTARSDSGYGGSRLVRLDPSGAVTVSLEIGTNWSGDAALAAADYDGDGVDEAFLATANLYDGYLAAFDFVAGVTAWASPAAIGDGRAVVAADVNGDGAPDLVTMLRDGHVQAWDVKNSTLLFSSTSLGTGLDVAVADLDADGTPEIVALSSARLVVFRKAPSGPVPWLEAGSVSLQDGVDLVVADCDGDGAPELYVLMGWSYPGMTVQRFDAALAPLGSFTVRGVAQSLFLEDLGFPRKNLVLAKGESWSGSGVPDVLEAVDPVSGGSIWQSPPLWGAVPSNSLHYVDLAGDGVREIAFGTSTGMYLTR